MSEPAGDTLRIGTRASKLARWQSDWVASQLVARGHAIEIVEIPTTGDLQQSGPIASLGSTGVFTKVIQQALIDGRVDVAVHSLKDLPTAPIAGLALAAIPEREGVRDALVSPLADSIDALPDGARVGTGSHRRRAQLLNLRPDLRVLDLRGNVDTRLRKLDEGQYDAILLAEAGLRRLGLAERITQAIPESQMLPAPGQGALGIECRVGDEAVLTALVALDHPATHAAVTAERAALARLEGGCLAAMGAWGRVEAGRLLLSTVVLSEDGSQRLTADNAGHPGDAEGVGRAAAEELIGQGARELLLRR